MESFKRARESLIRFSQDLKKAEEERVQGGRKRKREVVVEDSGWGGYSRVITTKDEIARAERIRESA